MAVIIYPPTIDWEYMRQRPQHLMLQFAENGHQVFYCNKTPLTYPWFEKITENLCIVHNVDLFLEKYIPHIKAGRVPVIVWCSWTRIASMLQAFQPDLIVYDCLDEFAEWLPYEPNMIDMADMVFCSSDYLMNRLTTQYDKKKISLLNNACDFAHFNRNYRVKPKKPADLPETTRARIGYMGAWAPWVDFDLVEKICLGFPQHQVVVIGLQMAEQLPLELPNFVFLGMKEYEQLPDYLAHLDVCIIPFKINLTTVATNPVKVYEYLAAGKPVVSTALPELNKIQPLVKIGCNHDHFLEQIKTCLKAPEDNIAERIKFARANSWETRYGDIEEVISREVAGFSDELGYYDIEKQGSLLNESFQCLYPTADTTLNSGNPGLNFDFDPMYIGRFEETIYQYLLKFDAAEIDGEVNKAILSVFIDKCDYPENFRCIEVRKVLDGWEETEVSWGIRPSFATEATRSATFDRLTGWLEWDVTQLVREWLVQPEVNFGVLLKAHNEEVHSLIGGVNRHGHDFYSPKLRVFL